MRFRITDQPIEEALLLRELEDPDSGGIVTFMGRVRNRNRGREVSSLEYEAYPELAEKEGLRILEEAAENWIIRRALAAHRTGSLRIGEPAVWIGVAAAHRTDAFAACQYIIDKIKVRVPIWKKEHYVDGESEWVEAGG